jgi:acyl dehydratase
MSEASLMSDELRKHIGVAGEPLVTEMEKGMLRKFVDAIGDPNPLWSDEEYAKKTSKSRCREALTAVVSGNSSSP